MLFILSYFKFLFITIITSKIIIPLLSLPIYYHYNDHFLTFCILLSLQLLFPLFLYIAIIMRFPFFLFLVIVIITMIIPSLSRLSLQLFSPFLFLYIITTLIISILFLLIIIRMIISSIIIDIISKSSSLPKMIINNTIISSLFIPAYYFN